MAFITSSFNKAVSRLEQKTLTYPNPLSSTMPPPTAIHGSDDNDTANVPERRTELKEQQKAKSKARVQNQRKREHSDSDATETPSDGTPSSLQTQESATIHWLKCSDASDTPSGVLIKQHISFKVKQKPEPPPTLSSPAPTASQPAPSAQVSWSGKAWKQLCSKRKWKQENGGGNLRKRQAT